MKKLLIAVAMLIASTGIFAQAHPKKDAKDSKMSAVKKDTAKKATAKVVPMTKTTPAAGATKKDGTADMRFKENKEAAKAKPAGPVKKDGSADMRYKANKKDSTRKKS
ncbi:MAG: hypothetical protein ABJB86_13845 [Bacteroidota bacterium]